MFLKYDGIYKTPHELNQMNLIDLCGISEKTITDKIKPYDNKIADINIALDEAILIYDSEEFNTKLCKDGTVYKLYSYYKAEYDNEKNINKIHVEIFVYNNREYTIDFIPMLSFNILFTGLKKLSQNFIIEKLNYKNISNITYPPFESAKKAVLQGAAYNFMKMLFYVDLIEKDKEVEYRRHTINNKKDNSKTKINNYKKREKIEVVLNKKIIYTMTVNYGSFKPSRHYDRHTSSWNVIGHYRHYKKSGKTIWIHPFTKGKEEPLETKKYKLIK